MSSGARRARGGGREATGAAAVSSGEWGGGQEEFGGGVKKLREQFGRYKGGRRQDLWLRPP
jgi:hypothetical protein